MVLRADFMAVTYAGSNVPKRQRGRAFARPPPTRAVWTCFVARRAYLQVVPPGSPSASVAGVEAPTPMTQVDPEALACVA